jgi:hypothetical protein
VFVAGRGSCTGVFARLGALFPAGPELIHELGRLVLGDLDEPIFQVTALGGDQLISGPGSW